MLKRFERAIVLSLIVMMVKSFCRPPSNLAGALPNPEQEHLEIAKRRLADIESGKVSVVDGPSVVAAAPRILES